MDFPSLQNRLRKSLQEDRAFFDLSTRLIDSSKKSVISVDIMAKQPGIVCGLFLVKPLFTLLGSRVKMKLHSRDGGTVKPGKIVGSISGPASVILAGERVFLNLLCHLSGIATQTNLFVQAVKHSNTKILDTRKTTPLWRDLEKYAVVCGGGENHRFSLEDAVMIKDNHWQLMKKNRISLSTMKKKLLKRLKRGKKKQFIVEANYLNQVWEAIISEADVILLDNMPLDRLRKALVLIKAKRNGTQTNFPLSEVTGGVQLSRVHQLARLGVDRISIGRITHSAPALDFSFEAR